MHMNHVQADEIRSIMKLWLVQGGKPKKRISPNKKTGRAAIEENYKHKQFKRLIAIIDDIQHHESDYRLEAIGAAQIVRYWKRQQNAGAANKTIAAKYSILNHFFRAYADRKMAPPLTVPVPHQLNRKSQSLTVEKLEQ